MPSISKKELNKFMKANPDSQATQAIKEQLGETPAAKAKTTDDSELTAGSGQIRNTVSDLVAKKVNDLHSEVLNGLKGIFIKAIEIGEILSNQKDALKHGEWLDWVENQLDIGPRQVQNYIKIYNRREQVGFAMEELIESGLKPSFRKMLEVVTKKDNQTTEQYKNNQHKDTSDLTAKERKQRRQDEKREKEILTLAEMYIDKNIDDNSLTVLVTKWNMDNPNNSLIYIENVRQAGREMEQELYPDIFNPTPIKNNVTISIDADLWDSFVEVGGGVVYLEEYISEYLRKYVIEQRSYRIAN
jgi:hypothetical protein